MKKTFLAIGSALLLALTFAACDMGENRLKPTRRQLLPVRPIAPIWERLHGDLRTVWQ